MQSSLDVEAYYLVLAEQAHSELFGPQRGAWLERLEREYVNLRTVLHWLAENGEAEKGLRLATALREFWLGGNHLSEGRDWLAEFLALPQAVAWTTIRAHALDVAGALAFWQSDQDVAQALMGEGLAIRRELGDRPGIAVSLIHLGTNKWIFECDYTTARTLYEESLAIYQELNNRTGIAYSQLNLGNLALEQGDYSVAYLLLKESLITLRGDEDLWAINFALDSLAGVAAGQGRSKHALCLAGASEALRESIGILLPPVWRVWIERLLESARWALDENICAAVWTEGQAMTPEQAISYALEERFAI